MTATATALLLMLCAAQTAPLPAPPASPAAGPTASPTASPAAPPPAGAAPASTAAAEPRDIPPEEFVGPVLPREVWVFLDRWKEFGGWVVRESDIDIVVCDGTETRTFDKAQVLEVVELSTPQPGQRGVIQLRDGSSVRGIILRDDLEGVEFQVDKVIGKLPRHQVYRVTLLADFNDRYRARKALASPEEHGRRLALGQWLIDEGRLDLALQELESLVRDSDMDAARDLLRSVRARMKLAASTAEEQARAKSAGGKGQGAKRSAPTAASPPPVSPSAPDTAPGTEATPISTPAATPTASPGAAPTTETVAPAGTAPATPPDAAPNPGPPSPRDLLPKDLLTDEDVNLIRVYEIDFRDPPHLRVSPEGIRQLILRYGNSSLIPSSTPDRNALYQKQGVEIARLMFDLKARDLYRYIEVQEDPPSLARFRTRVHNSWMLPNCATSRCHGGVQAGHFFLYTGNAKDARIRYTNMITLLEFGVDGRPMVNFETPADSLLVQYAMPRHLARYPHPDVPGWKPVFAQGAPQLMQDTLEWIRGMYQPRPSYPIEYKAPKLDAPDKPVRTIEGPDR